MTDTYTVHPVWLLSHSGAMFALDRVEAEFQSDNGSDAGALRATCEAIWWICNLDEVLNNGEHSSDYSNFRERQNIESLIAGIRWARNRITHQPAHWKIAEPPFLWADAASIPMSNNPKHNHGVEQYKTNCEGKPVIQTLRIPLNPILEFCSKFHWSE